MEFKVIQSLCHHASRDGGWWNDPETKYLIATKLALIHSEISEALEGYRKDTMSSHLPRVTAFEEELADAVIRILDLAGYFNFNLGLTITEKIAYNKNRLDHQPSHRNAPGGKAF